MLDQDRIWIDEAGRVHLLAEMGKTYLANVLTFLLGRGRTLQRHLAIARVCDLLDAVDENLDPIEIGHIAVLAIDTLGGRPSRLDQCHTARDGNRQPPRTQPAGIPHLN